MKKQFAILVLLLVCVIQTSMYAQTTRNASTYAQLTAANTASVDGDIINITNNIVVSAQLTISSSLTINGNSFTISVPVPGLDDMGRFNVSASAWRVFEFNGAGKSVVINNLTIKGGNITSAGGAICVSSTLATLTLNRCTVSNSRTSTFVGGGGIYNKGVLFINASYISRNSAEYGGGILNDGGKAYLESCTMVENRATSSNGAGGAVENKSAGIMYFNNSTLSNNQSLVYGGAINNYNSTLYFINSSVTGNVVYSGATCKAGAVLNLGGTFYGVNSLFAYNYKATGGSDTSPTGYVLDDIIGYTESSDNTNIKFYNCIYHATLPVSYPIGASVSNIHFTGNINGSDNTIFSGGSFSKLTDINGNEIGDAIYRPFLYNNSGSVAPTLKSGSFVLSNLGTRTRYANNNNVNPVVAYYNGSTYVNLTGTSSLGQEVLLDQVGAARPNPPASGAIQGTVDNLYMLKVLGSSYGTVNGGTLYGDVYPSGTSVSVTAIPNSGYAFSNYTYVLGGSGTASTSNPYTFTLSSDITLQPLFTVLSGGNYAINYLGNGYTGGSVPAGGTFSASTTIAAAGTMVRTGYSFNGWNTNSNGSGTAYAASATYSAGLNLVLYAQWVAVPVQVAGSIGSTLGNYNTLYDAFTAINAGTHRGVITIMINGSTSESASAVLNASGSGSSDYSSINMYPIATGLSITGNLGAPLIDLNGADAVIIDGRVNQMGSTADLTIANTNNSNTVATSTIRFINDASLNTVKYCYLKGSSRAGTAPLVANGIVFFSTGVATGNNNNSISNNNITNAGGNRPSKVIYAAGTVSFENSGNSISNNNIYDILFLPTSTSMGSYGVFVGVNNTNYTVSGNSFYETTAYTGVAASTTAPQTIVIRNTGTGYTISNNYIGGSAPRCGGAAYTKTSTGSTNNSFYGIILGTGSTGASNIDGNVIKNINWSNSGGANFYGIRIYDGIINIGTNSGNIIGGTSGNDSIVFTNSSTLGAFYGMSIEGINDKTISNNVIGAITVGNSDATTETNFYGINSSYYTMNITLSNNIIGNTETANSINVSSASSANIQSVYGMYLDQRGSKIITNNIIANITNGTTNTGTTVYGVTNGIHSTNTGVNTISNNTIKNLKNSNYNTNNANFESVTGIMVQTSTAGQNITNNTIFNLSNDNPSFAGVVNGLYHYCGSGTSSTISRNFIYNLSSHINSTGVSLYGIQTAAGAPTLSNNIIYLNGDNGSNLYGIFDGGGTNNVYFNTIYIDGSTPAGTNRNSYCLYSDGSNIRDYRNNIFVNNRNGGTSANPCVYIHYIPTHIDYNDYFYTGSGVHGIGISSNNTMYASLISFQGYTSQDSHSKNVNPTFTGTDGTLAAHYLPSDLTLIAAIGTGITTDYAGIVARSVTSPTMGAWELAEPCLNPTSGGTIAAAQTICHNADPAAFTSSAAASGQAGNLEYKWQWAVSPFTTWNDISSSNSSTYDASALTVTTQYKRLARVSCANDWSGAVASNVLEITVLTIPTSGVIATAQTICYGTAPAALTSTTAGTGTGTITYEWQTDLSGSYATIGSQTSATYQPPILTASTSYQRRTVSTLNGNVCYSGYATAIAITVSQTPTTAVAGTDQTGAFTCGLTSVTLAGNTATDGTGSWSIQSGTGGSFTAPSSPTSTFTGTAGSTYTLHWTISNSPCTASTDDVVITFNINPIALVLTGSTISANPGTDGTITSSTSASGINYQLYNSSNALVQAAQAGTGSTLIWSGLSAGNGYYVISTNATTSCVSSSSNAVNVLLSPPGNALAFDGVDDFVNAGNNNSVQISNGTIEAWIKTSDAGSGYRAIIVKQWAYGLYLVDNVLKVFEWYDGSGGVEYSTGVNLADNRWHHVAFCFNSGVTNGSFIYIDGELKNTLTYSSATQSGIQNVALTIGQGAISPAEQNFKGAIDEVHVWNTVRTQSELQSNMYSELAGTESGLVAYYNFNQGVAGDDNTSITTLIDKTSNSNNGTLTNLSNTGSTSNFVESYALVVPVPAAATSITGEGFTANWTAPVTGIVSSYKLDVSTSSSFSSFVSGYNSLDCGTNLSQAVSGLTPGVSYYYRVKANKISVTGTGAYYRTPITVTTTCANPTDGGSIANAQTICYNADPAAFTSTAAASGQTGTIEYKWQWAISPFTTWNDILGSNSEIYDAAALTTTTQYKRLARASCMNDWVGAPESNVLEITVSQTPTTANAGSDQTGAATCGLTELTLAGNTPLVGSGLWNIISGTGGSITAPSSPTSTFTGTAGSTYTLSWTISNTPCTASTDYVDISFNTIPEAPIGPATQTYCLSEGKTVGNLTATLIGTNIIWYDAATNGSVINETTLLTSRTYYASQTSLQGCESTSRKAVAVSIVDFTITIPEVTICSGATTVDFPITASKLCGVGSFSLTFGFNPSQLSNPTIISRNSAFDFAGHEWDSFEMTTNPLILANGTFKVSSFAYNAADAVSLNPNDVLFTLRFNIGAFTSNAALSFVENLQGTDCELAGIVPDNITFNDMPMASHYINGGVVKNNLSANTITANQTICMGGTPASLTGSTVSGGSISYQWQISSDSINYVNIDLATSKDYQPAYFATNKWYKRIATSVLNSVSCSIASDSVKVKVLADPSWTSYSLPTPTTLCDGGSIAFSVAVTGGLGGDITWIRSATSGGSGTTVTTGDIPEVGTWYYRPHYTPSGEGCNLEDGTETTVTVSADPSWSSYSLPSPTELCSGGSVAFSVAVTGGVGGTTTWIRSATSGGAGTTVTTGDVPAVGIWYYRPHYSATEGGCNLLDGTETMVTVSLDPSWSAYSLPSPTTLSSGGSIAFGVSVTGGLGGDITWIRSTTSGGAGTTVTTGDTPGVGTWYYRPHYTPTGVGCNLLDGTETSVTVYARQKISGVYTYYNIANTPLSSQNITVKLYRSSDNVLMGTKTSNALGYYEFDSLRYDDYYIVTTSTHITDGSVNTTDAAQINSWSIAPYNIEKVRFYAGDVTGSSIFINGTDAQSILNNFVNGDPFNRLSWTFWKKGETISSNTSPTQSYPSVTLTAGGGNSTVNMYGLCTGDFNRSYNPQLSKSISTTLSLVNSGNIQVGNEQEFDLPIRTVNANRVGAVSLILNFPANVVDIQDVVMNSAYGQLNWAVNGNELRIGWYSEAALNLNASDILLTLKLKTKSTSNAELIKFSLAANPLNELANEQNEVIDNAVLSIAEVNGSATGIEEPNQTNTLVLSNQPNPFNGTTMINYTLPFDGKLKLEMYNYMGSLVKVLTNEDQTKGLHSLKFEDSSLASGIYMVTLSVKTENNEMFKTIKLVNNR